MSRRAYTEDQVESILSRHLHIRVLREVLKELRSEYSAEMVDADPDVRPDDEDQHEAKKFAMRNG